jgi:hypothetical protein
MVATMFNMVPISVDGSENPERAASAELFCFSLFASSPPSQILLGQVLRPGPDAPRRICFRSLDVQSHGASREWLKQTVNDR